MPKTMLLMGPSEIVPAKMPNRVEAVIGCCSSRPREKETVAVDAVVVKFVPLRSF